MSANLTTTVNGTQPSNCSSLSNLTADRIGKTFAYCLILAVSLAGNSLIGIIVYKTKAMRRTTNYLIVNMAMSDLLFPIFIVPQKIVELYVEYWFIGAATLGQVLCKMVPFLKHLSCIVSIESLLLIAVDRFGAVVFPLRRPLISSKLCPFLILATWISAIIFLFPYLMAFQLVEYGGKWMCKLRFTETSLEDNYLQLFPSVFFCISFVSIIILYSIILFKLRSQKIPGEPSSNAEEQRVRRHRNVVKMVIALVSGFSLCWGPVFVCTFLVVMVWKNTTTLSCGIISFKFIAEFIAYANCAVNPCICFAFSGNYRKGLKGVLGCHGTLQG